MVRVITGDATKQEKDEFYSSLVATQDTELYYDVKSLWLRTTINHDSLNVDLEFDTLWKKIKQPVKYSSSLFIRKILKYAAIALILLSIGGITGGYIFNIQTGDSEPDMQRYTALKGSVSIVELSDGTKIWLNSQSVLTYREDIINKQRIAELEGEAYFEVTHRADCPLLVSVGNLVIRDLGTTFNIRAYKEDNSIITSLVSGKADLLNNNGYSLLTLVPGESAVYSIPDNKIEIHNNDKNILSAWREGKFVIRNQRLEDIFNELSRWYNIEFIFEKQSLRDYRYTGCIKKSTTAQHVLKMLKLTTNFNYRIIEKPDDPDVIVIY